MDPTKMPRFAMRTRYHVWTIIDRGESGWKDKLVYSIGARGIGDDEARSQARAELSRLNATVCPNEGCRKLLSECPCGFCHGKPVGDAASWVDGVERPPAPCPRCGDSCK